MLSIAGGRSCSINFPETSAKLLWKASMSWPSPPAMSIKSTDSGSSFLAPLRRISSTGNVLNQFLRVPSEPAIKVLKFLIIGGSLISHWNIPSGVLCESWKGPGALLICLKPVDSKYLGILAKERVPASNLCAPINYRWSRDRFTHMNW